MAQSGDSIFRDTSVVEVGKAQRSGDWPKPGDEGFVHPDGTPQSERQLIENKQAAANREAAGSGVHGAPGQGGIAPGAASTPDESDLAKARREHTDWVRDGLADLADAEAEDVSTDTGKHEAPTTTSTSSKSTASDTKTA